MGYATYIQTLCDEFDVSCLPGMKPISWFYSILIILLLPFTSVKAALIMLFTFEDYNAAKKNLPMTGRKNAAFSLDID